MIASLDRQQLKAQLIRHEALKLKLYIDPAGKPTIGVGRNLEDTGITEDEALYLLSGDIDRVIRALVVRFPGWFPALDPVRQAALVNMGFNLGIPGLSLFTQMIAALQARNYEQAADDMIASKWATQVGYRALELSAQIRTGEWGVPGEVPDEGDTD